MSRQLILTTVLALSILSTSASQEISRPAVQSAELGSTRNVHVVGHLYLAGQPQPDDLTTIQSSGIKRIVTLRDDGELDWDEGSLAKEAGLDFQQVAVGSADALSDGIFDELREILRGSDRTPTLLHCGSAHRVSAVWYTFRVLDQGVDAQQALEEAKTIGLRPSPFYDRALAYVAQQTAETSVNPGINDNFLQPNLDIEQWMGRFEVESREVFAARQQVLQAVGLQPGQCIADIGAGTGLYTGLFSQATGQDGWVYAVDIAPSFVQHIRDRVAADRLANVSVALCAADSITLPPDCVDIAFVCDTYHHFEFPQKTLASIHRALKPQGELVVIDFERIPGQSREWLINHVRAGKKEFRGEIELAGFEFIKEEPIEGFRENYFLRFRCK